MKKRKLRTIGSNGIDPASTTNRDWGFIPVPNKGGATTNHAIPNGTFERELKELKEDFINA